MMRIGVGFAPTLPSSTACHGPTAKATRYEGSGRVAAKRTAFMPSPASVSDTIGVFATATSDRGTRSVSCQGTLKPGSSKHGKARRAERGSNCVIAYQASPSCRAKMPRVELRLCSASNASVSRCAPAGSARLEGESDELLAAVLHRDLGGGRAHRSARYLHVVGVEPEDRCGRSRATSIAISPATFASPGTMVSVNS